MRTLQCQISQSTKSKGAVTAGKASPAIMKNMVLCFAAGVDSDQSMLRGTLFWLAASDQVWSWSSNCVFDHIRQKGSQHDADSKTKYCDIGLM